jgi:hypothetical protein
MRPMRANAHRFFSRDMSDGVRAITSNRTTKRIDP